MIEAIYFTLLVVAGAIAWGVLLFFVLMVFFEQS